VQNVPSVTMKQPQQLCKLLCVVLCLFFLHPMSTTAFSGPIALNVKVSVKPERREDFLKIIQYDAEQTLLTEPGALQFTVGEDVESANIFYFHEQYRTIQDVDFHKSTPHFLKWVEFQTTDPFTEPLMVDLYQCNHEPTPVPMRPAYCLNVQLCIQPEARDEFLKVILNNQQGSRKEPLCLQYDVGENIQTPNVFHFHEQYTGKDDGKEGFNAHAAAPHFAVWEEFASKGAGVFTKDPVVHFFRTVF
jgi:(4S)-4-hydroxy-5-phosphonooxypentane-2,3-dione isomerase